MSKKFALEAALKSSSIIRLREQRLRKKRMHVHPYVADLSGHAGI